MNRAAIAFAVTIAFAGTVSPAHAQGAPGDVLVESGSVKLTRADYEAELQRLPADQRAAFAADPKRVTQLLNNMLVGKTLAAEARKQGLEQDAVVQRRMALEADKVLAEVDMQRFEAAAGAEFDAKLAQYLPKARERYLVDKSKFVTPEQIEASHILFLTNARSEQAALALAKQMEARLAAGADFASLAREFSEDPGTKSAGGHINWFGAKQMDPAFGKAAFALKNVGDISPPVLSSFGYHLIRLDGRRPERQLTFDEVKDQILADMRQAYVGEQRANKLAAIRNDTALKVNQQAVDSLIVRMPDSAELRRLMLQSQPK
jgi:peptidyl-prolyl cis-trans isomerase C